MVAFLALFNIAQGETDRGRVVERLTTLVVALAGIGLDLDLKADLPTPHLESEKVVLYFVTFLVFTTKLKAKDCLFRIS